MSVAIGVVMLAMPSTTWILILLVVLVILLILTRFLKHSPFAITAAGGFLLGLALVVVVFFIDRPFSLFEAYVYTESYKNIVSVQFIPPFFQKFYANEGMALVTAKYSFFKFLPSFVVVSLIPFLVYFLLAFLKTSNKKSSDSPAKDNPDAKKNDKPKTHNLSDLSDDELMDWLKYDKPIEDVGTDYFNYHQYADHLAKIIKSSPGKTIAILGDYGSGKTSLNNLIMEKVNPRNSYNDSNIIFVRKETWAADDYKNVIQILIDELVESLSDHLESFGLKNVSDKYMKSTLKGNGSWWSIALGALTEHLSPTNSLEKISEALAAIDKNVVLIIEDLDREIGKYFQPSDLDPLLYNLREAKRISFILNVKPDVIEDAAKIIDYEFIIPRIKEDLLVEVFSRVRNATYNRFEDIDPLKEKREKVKFAFIRDILNYFIGNPRGLKTALRRTATDWGYYDTDNHHEASYLHGEVDIDQLFLLNMLRIRHRKEFYKYIDYKRGERLEKTSEEKQKDHSIQTDKEKNSKDKAEKDHLCRLFQFLDHGYLRDILKSEPESLDKFPTLDGRSSINERYLLNPDNETLQGMQNLVSEGNSIERYNPSTFMANYFERAVNGFVPPSEVRDQDALSLIQNVSCKKTRDEAIQRIVEKEDTDYRGRIEHFLPYVLVCNHKENPLQTFSCFFNFLEELYIEILKKKQKDIYKYMIFQANRFEYSNENLKNLYLFEGDRLISQNKEKVLNTVKDWMNRIVDITYDKQYQDLPINRNRPNNLFSIFGYYTDVFSDNPDQLVNFAKSFQDKIEPKLQTDNAPLYFSDFHKPLELLFNYMQKHRQCSVNSFFTDKFRGLILKNLDSEQQIVNLGYFFNLLKGCKKDIENQLWKEYKSKGVMKVLQFLKKRTTKQKVKSEIRDYINRLGEKRFFNRIKKYVYKYKLIEALKKQVGEENIDDILDAL